MRRKIFAAALILGALLGGAAAASAGAGTASASAPGAVYYHS